jgi:o-succinylbenzoate synthase
MKFDSSPRTLTLVTPIRSSRAELKERRGWTVMLRTDFGVGRGEAFPLPAWGTESYEACQQALQDFAVGHLPVDLDDLEFSTRPLHLAPAARFAVESVLLELLSIKSGLSIAEWLGAHTREVPVNALIEGATAEVLAHAARAAVKAGFRTLKIKVGAHSLPVDAQRLHEVRLAVGPEIKLRVDANGGWSEAMARSALRGLESLNLELCEQPVGSHDVEALRRLRIQVPCKVAADESLQDADLRSRVLKSDPRPAADYLVLKPAVLGGLVPALALARRAAAVGVHSYATTLIDGPIARAGAAHLAACLHDAPAQGLGTVELFEGATPDAYTPQGGVLRLPTGTGWGLP